MKFTIRQIAEGEEEVILKYRSMTPEVERLIHLFDGERQGVRGWRESFSGEKMSVRLEPADILYLESVDGKTYAYTEKEVVRVDYALNRLEMILDSVRFFRCSKSMILNIDRVESLKSLPSNRIDAVMCNGEHIIISRTYASDFRRRLRGGAEDE